MKTSRNRLSVEVLALGAILVVAAVLRFVHLQHQGFMVYDDAVYVIGAQRIALGEEVFLLADAYDTEPELVVTSQLYYRPGFIVPVILSARLLGWSPLTSAAVSAVFGLLTIGIVYGLVRQFFDRRSALLATALLATSTWHIFHSRLGLSNATATFFWATGLYCWVRFSADRTRSLLSAFFAGLLFGYAFTCHYTLAVYLGVGLVFEFWLAVQARAYQGTFLMLLGFLISFYGFGYGVNAPYGHLVWEELFRLSQSPQSPPEFFYYLRFFWRYETLPLIIFCMVGAIRAVLKLKENSPDRREVGLYALFFCVLIFLSIGAAKGAARPRLMLPLFPILAVLSGGAATLLLNSALLRRSRTVLWGITLGLILLIGLVSNREFFSWHSGFEEAAEYLHTHYPANRYACAGWWAVCRFYQLTPHVTTAHELQAMQPRPEFVFIQATDPMRTAVFGEFPGKLLAEFENQIEKDPRIIAESLGSPDTPGVIRLYDLRN